jgi:hypothetical protein
LAFARLKQLMLWVAHRTVDAWWRDVLQMLDETMVGDAAGIPPLLRVHLQCSRND